MRKLHVSSRAALAASAEAAGITPVRTGGAGELSPAGFTTAEHSPVEPSIFHLSW
jgi:hypothetical protein